jgi:hypothetical protein
MREEFSTEILKKKQTEILAMKSSIREKKASMESTSSKVNKN